ncbi:MAG: 30S ribosomal protein S21 [Dehalococcoidales bacterium]|nr:30S ribosomal protein S21 [Dehalococcoidales bacterium]MDP6449166.1 30S ribosomal protein S21 [Dehalococcoidales bacterium]MDP6576345.1 30S ribosomal protein S21 [Dehalococcoidales bacterium]MDP6825374.1 30S ribosomal protein S21 [Dehalococcoidales bacterium]
MAEVVAGERENFESLLKRFNKKVQQTGILSELRRREHYEKPSVRRKRKRVAKRRSVARAMRR